MKKIITILMIMATAALTASTYDIKTSMMGKVGEVQLSHSNDGRHYSIVADIKATGLAKMLSKKLHYINKSEGFIKNGEYYATKYSLERNRGGKRSIKVYTFDYKKKTITKHYRRWKSGKLVKNTKTTLSFFTHIDGLNVYPHIVKFKKTHPAGEYSVIAAGAEKIGGKVDFVIADKYTASSQLHHLGMKSGSIIQIFASKDFFANGYGSLTFGIDNQDTAQSIELKEIKSVGIVTAKKVH